MEPGKSVNLSAIKSVRDGYVKLKESVIQNTNNIFQILQTKAKNGLAKFEKFTNKNRNFFKATGCILGCVIVFAASAAEFKISIDKNVEEINNFNNSSISVSANENTYTLSSNNLTAKVNAKDVVENVDSMHGALESIGQMINGIENLKSSKRNFKEQEDFNEKLEDRYQIAADILKKTKQKKEKLEREEAEKNKNILNNTIESTTSSNQKEDISIVQYIEDSNDFDIEMEDVDGDGKKDEIYSITSERFNGEKYEAILFSKDDSSELNKTKQEKDER